VGVIAAPTTLTPDRSTRRNLARDYDTP
jgi:hypothetical protein